jgi:hypothetical protein
MVYISHSVDNTIHWKVEYGTNCSSTVSNASANDAQPLTVILLAASTALDQVGVVESRENELHVAGDTTQVSSCIRAAV